MKTKRRSELGERTEALRKTARRTVGQSEGVEQMRKTARHISPSRVRYEQAHPTVSCRVPMDIHKRLVVVKEAEGKNFTDILKIGLGILEVRTEGKASIQKQAHAKGYQKGYAEAERLYKVTYACTVMQADYGGYRRQCQAGCQEVPGGERLGPPGVP